MYIDSEVYMLLKDKIFGNLSGRNLMFKLQDSAYLTINLTLCCKIQNQIVKAVLFLFIIVSPFTNFIMLSQCFRISLPMLVYSPS